jgi:DNA-binding LacI/PurR family transcriptional regulator
MRVVSGIEGIGARSTASQQGHRLPQPKSTCAASYRAALDRVGITYDEELVAHGNSTTHPGWPGCAAARAGLRVPHDLSVVGIDDVPMAQWVSLR